MNEDQAWSELTTAWKAPSSTVEPGPSIQAIKSDSRRMTRLIWLIGLIVGLAIAFVTSLLVLHRSIMTFTFAVITWSAIFVLGSYLLSTHNSAKDLALDTATSLITRSSKLRRSAQLLESGQTLIGVETLICLGFWVAVKYGQPGRIWPSMATIAFAGFFLYIGLSWVMAKTRRKLLELELISGALRGGEWSQGSKDERPR